MQFSRSIALRLDELIDINLDSRKGFCQAADHFRGTPCETLCSNIASQRARQAAELQELLPAERRDSHEASATKQRTILNWCSSFEGEAESVLRDVQRGEDYIKAKYEAAISKLRGSAAVDVLNRQYAAVIEAREKIRQLRKQLQPGS